MKVSILTAYYNSQKYFKDYIKSIYSQRYNDIEIIIVDDCSDDGSAGLLSDYSRKDDRIKLICNKQRIGCGGSYAEALEHASGDICCVLDSDDALISENSLTKLINKYNQFPNIDYIWTQFWVCTNKLKKIRKGHSSLPDTAFLTAALNNTKHRHSFSHWRTFRTKLRDKDKIFNKDLKAAVDKWMSYILEEIGSGGFYDEPLYLYRRRENGLTYKGKKYWKKFIHDFKKKRKLYNITPILTVKL